MRTLYYRNCERITEKERDEMIDLFGEHIFNTFNYFDTNNALDIHPELAPLIFTIENNCALNERHDLLIKRIKENLPDLTPSTSYYSISVEHNLCNKLINEAWQLLIKDEEYNVDIWRYQGEIYRYYGLPYKPKYKKEIEKARKNIAEVTKPKKFYDWECYFSNDKTYSSDVNDSYLEYYIKLKSCSYLFKGEKETIYKEFPYLGKVYWTGEYLQIYVYDKANRHWAVNNVIKYLIKNKLIQL